MEYEYQKDADLDKLTVEIHAGLNGKLNYLKLHNHIDLTVVTLISLSAGEKSTLDQIINSHIK